MQRFGPPSSYPGLKIPGLNTPIPTGCRFGYGSGEWGKVPVDHDGYALYGNVFCVEKKSQDELIIECGHVDKALEWGKIKDIETETKDKDNDETQILAEINSTITGT